MKKMLSVALLLGLTAAGRALGADAPATQPAVSWSGEVILSGGPGSPMPVVKASWLGVSAVHAQPVLLKQLKQKAGLVVAAVEPGSPAEHAGLKTDDLITKLDDQLLINPEQLRDLIRMHDAGQTVTVTLLREGQEMKIAPKLVEHEVVAVTAEEAAGAGPALLSLYRAAGGDVPNGAKVFVSNPSVVVGTRPGGAGGNALQFSINTIYSGNGHAYVTSTRDGKKQLLVTDETGKTLFNGPVESVDDQGKIPADLQEGFKAMQKMETNLQMQPGAK
jgi:membrane-associated protease RseP (regulator of RpoE activity)